jgi:GNAT superfamily N-acetyltransferase
VGRYRSNPYTVSSRFPGGGSVQQDLSAAYEFITLFKFRCAAGFRFAEFFAWGKILYIDDLITIPEEKKRGYAGKLLDWLIAYAQNHQCNGVHLDTGYTRHDAHRLYLRKGFQLSGHHLALQLD